MSLGSKHRKDAAREARIVSGFACPACGSPAGQKCREGTVAHDARRGIEDLRPVLPRVHRERRFLLQEAKS
jgi:hypothetical protein